MIVDFLEYFYSEKYNDKILLKKLGKDYSVADIKTLVRYKMDFIKNIQQNAIGLDAEDCFEFIINFLACVFSNKKILLNYDCKIDEDVFFLSNQIGKNLVPIQQINPNAVMITFYTSGSSGDKKPVIKTLKNLIKEGLDLADEFDEIKDKEFVSTTTLNHLFGMTFHLMLPLNSGGIINTDRINYPENINTENLVLVSSPSFLDKMAKYLEIPRLKPNTIITAGAKLKKETFDYALGISKNVIEIYGSTETGVIAFRKKTEDNLKLFKNVQVIIQEERVEVSTPYSYCQNNLINDNIEIIAGREMTVLGRTDRVLKILEKRISAEEIEQALLKNEFVQDVYCLKHSEKLACLVALNKQGNDFVISSGISELKKVLKTFLADKFEIIPQKWKFIDEIPKNLNGKIDKEKIENIFNLNLSFPLILSRKYGENFAIVDLYFYRHCNFFKGHFENYPILPGVVQLFFAGYFAKDAFGVNCSSGQFRRIKFSNLIRPDKIVTLKLEYNNRGVSYSYYDDVNTYSSGQLPIRNYWEE